MARKSELPKSKIIVRGGAVDEVEEWTLWNGEPWITIEIRRDGDRFYCNAGDPEHGGWEKRGTLEEVLARFHSTIAEKYHRLFTLAGATKSVIREAGFRGYEIEIDSPKADVICALVPDYTGLGDLKPEDLEGNIG